MMRLPMFAATLFAAMISPGYSDEFKKLELYEWNDALTKENWRVLLGSTTTESLGVFLTDPKVTDLDSGYSTASNAAESLKKCGITLVELKRSDFSSPPVPNEVVVSDQRSRALSPTIDKFMKQNPNVKTVSIIVGNPTWSRILTSETTSLLYTSAIWGDPSARAALIQCIKAQSNSPLTESKIYADIYLKFLDTAGSMIRLSSLDFNTSSATIMHGSPLTDDFTLHTKGAKLARRRGICVDEFIYFKNAEGSVGGDKC